MKDRVFIIDVSDERNIYAGNYFTSKGYLVFDFGENVEYPSDRIIYIFAPSTIVNSELAEKIRANSSVFAFKISENAKQQFLVKNIQLKDLLGDEIFAHKNAKLTAEGALAMIIEHSPYSLEALDVLVLGYGRVGKCVTNIMQGLTNSIACVTTKADEEILAEVFSSKKNFSLQNFADQLNKFNVIINTIPALILSSKVLDRLRKDTLIIDLASNPGGVDFDYARGVGLKVIHALSIPAKYSPASAGIYLAESILSETAKNS